MSSYRHELGLLPQTGNLSRMAASPADSENWDTAILIAPEAGEAAAHIAGYLHTNQSTA